MSTLSRHGSSDATLVDLLDRLVHRGVVVAGQVVLSVADVDLVYLDLRLLLGAIEPLMADRSEAPA